nr:hypothetical protein [Actinomadura roseirufa]
MNDDLDALLRAHYRGAADEIHAGPDTVRRFRDAGRAAARSRGVARFWAPPVLAAALTAAIAAAVAVAVLLWPAGREPARPRPQIGRAHV